MAACMFQHAKRLFVRCCESVFLMFNLLLNENQKIFILKVGRSVLCFMRDIFNFLGKLFFFSKILPEKMKKEKFLLSNYVLALDHDQNLTNSAHLNIFVLSLK